jgi:hypothetical protein
MWLERTDTITLGWRLDEAAQKAFVDLTWQAIEGHHAEEFADFLHAEPTRFAGFVDSAATMKLNVTLGPLTSDDALCLGDALEQFKQNAATSPSSGATEAQRQAEQQAVNEIADVVLQTAAEEGIDVAMSVFAKNQQVTVVLAADIADDERVERALERLSEAKDLPNVEWNHSTIGDVRCHRIAIDSNDIGPTGNKPEGILGFGPRSLYFAVGHEAEAALTRALETSNRTAASSLPPVHFTLSISDAIQHAPDAGRLDVLKAIWQDFPTKDHLNVSLQPVERGARIRIELEEGVVAALSKSIGVGIQQGFTSAGAGR